MNQSLINLLKPLWQWLNPYFDGDTDIVDNLKSEINALKLEENKCEGDLSHCIQQLAVIPVKVNKLETYCSKTFVVMNNIAYKNKREFMKVKPSLYLNELITPDAYEVIIRKNKLKLDNTTNDVKMIGDYISKELTWTADKDMENSEDFYIYPNEALLLKCCDCEDHSFTTASFYNEIGVAYGFYYPTGIENKTNKLGHSFCVFILDNQLWILDTTGNTSVLESYNESFKGSHYSINYIITKDKTYAVDPTTSFGELAGY